MSLRRIGDWGKAKRILSSAPARLRGARQRAIAQEAQLFRKEVIKGLTSGSPGGRPLQPLKATTLEARRLRGVRGSKARIARGDSRRAITVKKGSDEFFVGILRTARGRTGQSLVNVAEIQEFGKTIVVRITPKSRKFLAMVMRRAGKELPQGGGGGGTGIVVVKIPPRPIFQPVFDKLAKGSEQRMLRRVGTLLAGDLGLV